MIRHSFNCLAFIIMTFVGWFDKILEFFGSYLILYLGAIASVSAEKDFDSSTWAKDCWRYGGKENLIEVIFINWGHQQCYLEDGRVLRPDLDDDDDQQDDGQDHHQDNAWRNVVSKNSFCDLMSLAFMKNGERVVLSSADEKLGWVVDGDLDGHDDNDNPW